MEERRRPRDVWSPRVRTFCRLNVRQPASKPPVRLLHTGCMRVVWRHSVPIHIPSLIQKRSENNIIMPFFSLSSSVVTSRTHTKGIYLLNKSIRQLNDQLIINDINTIAIEETVCCVCFVSTVAYHTMHNCTKHKVHFHWIPKCQLVLQKVAMCPSDTQK